MADGKKAHEWAMTAATICTIAEPNRDHKKHSAPFEPDEFNPYRKYRKGVHYRESERKRGRAVTNIEELRWIAGGNCSENQKK